jgi:hypothetical protein
MELEVSTSRTKNNSHVSPLANAETIFVFVPLAASLRSTAGFSMRYPMRF